MIEGDDLAEFVDSRILAVLFLNGQASSVELLLKPPREVRDEIAGFPFLDGSQQFGCMAGEFPRGQPNRNGRGGVPVRPGYAIALAGFLSKDAVIDALRFVKGDVAGLHVPLQGGTTAPPLSVDRPLIFSVF